LDPFDPFDTLDAGIDTLSTSGSTPAFPPLTPGDDLEPSSPSASLNDRSSSVKTDSSGGSDRSTPSVLADKSGGSPSLTPSSSSPLLMSLPVLLPFVDTLLGPATGGRPILLASPNEGCGRARATERTRFAASMSSCDGWGKSATLRFVYEVLATHRLILCPAIGWTGDLRGSAGLNVLSPREARLANSGSDTSEPWLP
jgi:hypothetical protein